MRILLLPVKLILLPIILVLGVGRAFLIFVVAITNTLLSILSVILGFFGLAGLIIRVTSTLWQPIMTLVIAFLISPVGLSWIAEWLLDKLGDLNETMIDFVRYG